MPNLVKKLQLWYIPERRETLTSRSAEVTILVHIASTQPQKKNLTSFETVFNPNQ